MKRLKLYWQLAARYWRYFRHAQTIYDAHSPFIAALVNAVLEDDRTFYAFDEIELLRERLLENTTLLRMEDYGSGSKLNPAPMRKVADIARGAAISPATGRKLFRLTQFCKPQTILEMGASLGISTLYLHAAALNARIITLEGCPDVAAQAQKNFHLMQAASIELRIGVFEKLLPQTLQDLQTLDLLFLDGDHRYEATLSYFEQCLAFAKDSSVFIIADIHWSDAMENAWEQMCRHPRVRLSVDLFHFGILFFRSEQMQPQHFTLIEKRLKPWRLGIF